MLYIIVYSSAASAFTFVIMILALLTTPWVTCFFALFRFEVFPLSLMSHIAAISFVDTGLLLVLVPPLPISDSPLGVLQDLPVHHLDMVFCGARKVDYLPGPPLRLRFCAVLDCSFISVESRLVNNDILKRPYIGF